MDTTIKAKLHEANPDISFGESMQKHTTFRIGGPADALWLAKGATDVTAALRLAGMLQLPVTVIGNGSNLLVSDKGIRGLVIKIAEGMQTIRVEETSIYAEAGVLLSVLSAVAADSALAGLSFAAGIPGALGGAATMNAGAYGGEMAHVIAEVHALDRQGNTHVLQKDDLHYGYRHSAIMEEGYIVTDVRLDLSPGDKEAIHAEMQDFNQRRKEKQPLSLPSAGSVFKRPEGHFAGQLIESSGLKGFRIGGAEVSTLHAGFIVNVANASAEDVQRLIEHIQEVVWKKHGVRLETEMRRIGER